MTIRWLNKLAEEKTGRTKETKSKRTRSRIQKGAAGTIVSPGSQLHLHGEARRHFQEAFDRDGGGRRQFLIGDELWEVADAGILQLRRVIDCPPRL